MVKFPQVRPMFVSEKKFLIFINDTKIPFLFCWAEQLFKKDFLLKKQEKLIRTFVV